MSKYDYNYNFEDAFAIIAGAGLMFFIYIAILIVGQVFTYWIVAYHYNLGLLQGKYLGAARIFVTYLVVSLLSAITCGLAPIIYALVERNKITDAKYKVQYLIKQGFSITPEALPEQPIN